MKDTKTKIANANGKNDPSFLTKITHEIKSPLGGIHSLCSFLDDHWDKISDKDKKRYVSDISKASLNVSNLVNNLFSYSTINNNEISYKLTKVNFEPLIKSAMSSAELYLHGKQDLSIKYEKNHNENSLVLGDETWLEQLIANITINAAKYSNKGTILIKVDARDDYYHFSISDEGKGIPQDQLDYIFEAFTKSSLVHNVTSTGLGLAICKEIVLAHNGEIKALNNDKAGTTIYFKIPMSK